MCFEIGGGENLFEIGFGGQGYLRNGINVDGPFGSILFLCLRLFPDSVPDGAKAKSVLNSWYLVRCETSDDIVEDLFEDGDGDILVRAE